MKKLKISRRSFLAGTAAAIATGCTTTTKGKAPAKISTRSPNEVVNVAGIGCGGKGQSDIWGSKQAGANIVALCDVDQKTGEASFARFPDVPKYNDYRVMLEKQKDIDACTVSTPDHMHAMIAMACIKSGKHVYVQKPLTHSVEEARLLAEAAREYKVATQMGNQGHCGDGVRECCEMIWSGVIGDIHTTYTWTNRPIWPQGIPDPLPEEPVPPHMNWDVWIGGAPFRPYNHGYAPFNWRGWWDFGCGALGDMACHIMDPANWALKLGYPSSVECVMQENNNAQTGPTKSVIKYEFPKRGKMGPVTLYWYDGMEGNNPPPRPEGIPAETKIGDGDNGTLFIGTKGMICCGTYGEEPRLLPEELNQDFKKPDPTIERIPEEDPYIDWLRACKGGQPACSNFDYAGPFTEIVLLGNIALRTGKRIEWDGPNMCSTNCPEAAQYVKKQYREGWSL
jgi:predicted dehydrogenase